MTSATTNSKDELVTAGPTVGHQHSKWQPTIGEEAEGLLQRLRLPADGSRERIGEEAARILSECVPPAAPPDTDTGLVVGYVQSGKTMSFTAVTALARDNRYQIVIVIAGVSIPLFNQSEARLKRDLHFDERRDRKWRPFSNPKLEELKTIQGILNEWTDLDVPQNERQTILITVMKNHTHLRNLNQLLGALKLDRVPVLVIDDEADQASLNNAVRKGEESKTYGHLLAIRRLLPHHTFLQYTATPQAPLLINIIDTLSPKFVELLTPGAHYTGGKHFFVENLDLVKVIPPFEIPPKKESVAYPPRSLLEAMRIFFLGVATGYIRDQRRGNRSMMVHPAQETSLHKEFTYLIEQTKLTWERVLKSSDSEPLKQDLLDEFRAAYKELSRTVSDLPTFDELVRHLPRAMYKTVVMEVNARGRKTPMVNWRDVYEHILVGGAAMDRGFTVEGLTVTYMPRGAGLGHADSIQQRARFFGYKADYLGYCRVYLNQDTRDAYVAYVEHEEDIRRRLRTHQDSRLPLTEWKRAFFLDGSLKPTRDTVLDLVYMRGNYKANWFQTHAPHDSEEAVKDNRLLVQAFLKTLTLTPSAGHPARPANQKHGIADSQPIPVVLSDLLVPYRVARAGESDRFTGLRLQIRRWLDTHPGETCTIVHIANGLERERTVDENDEVPNLLQGANPSEATDTMKVGDIYPGDRAIHTDRLTIQIHRIRVRPRDGGEPISNLPALAVWVPPKFSRSWLSQPQGSRE